MKYSSFITEASIDQSARKLNDFAQKIGQLANSCGPKGSIPKSVINELGQGYQKDFQEIQTLLEDARMALEEIIMEVEQA